MKKALIAMSMTVMFTIPATAMAIGSQSKHLLLPEDDLKQLCYAKSNETQATYRQRASSYGLTLKELKRLEWQHVCENGQRLGSINRE